MTTRTFPSIRVRESAWDMVSNRRSFRSPFTGAEQRVQRGGTRWRVTLNLQALNKAQRATMQAFVTRVLAEEDNFTLPPSAYTLRGAGGGTPLVAGAGQTGFSLNIDGAPVSETGWLLAGDFFQVDNQLKMVTEDVDTNASGEATINFAPELRDSPADNAALDISSPTGIFMFEPSVMGWTNYSPALSDFTISCIEDVLA